MRNVDVDHARPVAQLHPDAIEAMLDRGSISDWRLLVEEIRRQPWGRLARLVDDIASRGEHYGVDQLMHRSIVRARRDADAGARRRFAARLRAMRHQAGLTLREVPELAGTSESRLSASENSRVAPTTTVFRRIEAVLHDHVDRHDPDDRR